jgi:serine/threonine protein kinase
MDRPRTSFPPASPDSAPSDEPRTGTPRADALAPGTRLEEFQIERVIGASGFGLVYLANDEAFERRVAIKEYLPDTLAVRGEDGAQVLLRAAAHADAFERGRRAFAEEAQLLARCEHPSLVHVLRSWEANGTVYRAMPHYPGHTLFDLREAMGAPPDEASLRALLEGLLAALSTLHDAGALHREVAPGNILLMPDDRPVLLDMSSARHAIVGGQARALMTLLAPSFAPPEQTAPSPDRPQGPWTDLYAVAMVVKYCIGGKLPAPASLYGQPQHEPMATVVRRLQERFPLLHYTPHFLAAIDTTLSLQPDRRPQSVAEFRALLDDVSHAGLHRIEPLFTDTGEIPPDDEPVFGPAAFDEPPAAGPDEPPPVPRKAESAWPPKPMPSMPPTQPVRAPRPAVAPVDAARGTEAAASAAGLSFTPGTPWVAGESFSAPSPRRGRERAAAPTFNFADAARRRRRRVAWMGGLLLLVAAGSAAWMYDQQRYSFEAQAGLADAARRDGLTANVPAVPKPADATVAEATPQPAPANPAPAPQPEVPVAAAPAPQVATAEPANTAAAPAPSQQAPTATSSAGTEAASPPPSPTVTASAEPVDEEPLPAPPKAGATVKKPAARSGTGTAHAARAATPTTPSRSTGALKPAVAEHGPRDACGNRTQFSLYRCMQTQCAQAQWSQHPVCKRLRIRDEVE